MENLVPTAFSEVAQCFTSERLEDGKTLVGLCTTSGQLLEFIDGKVVDSCDIDKEADHITTFTSYDPLQKYFLVRCKSQLIVVKRGKPLSIIKTYENVVEVKIRDRLLLGRPQVVISTVTDKEPIVTDFTGQLLPAGSKPVPLMTSSLTRKLQEMGLRLKKARTLLQEKRTALINAVYQLTPHLKPPDSPTQSEPKVLVCGPPIPEPESASQPPLQLSSPWKHSHNGKWVIGFPVVNTSTETVENVRLRLRIDCQKELTYDTHLIVFPQRTSSGAQWMEPLEQGELFQRQANIPAHSVAVVVGVIEEPIFKKSSTVCVSGVVLYRHEGSDAGKDFQDLLESVQFKVEDLVSGSLKPFHSPDLSTEDGAESSLVSVVVTSTHWSLRVSSRLHMPTPLQLSDCGLQLVPALQCWVGSPQGSLAGLLVTSKQLTPSQHRVELYATDSKQALQFVHGLINLWNVEEFQKSSASLNDCVKSLRAELQLLLSAAKPDKDRAQRWGEFLNQLHEVELATDLTFASYPLP